MFHNTPVTQNVPHYVMPNWSRVETVYKCNFAIKYEKGLKVYKSIPLSLCSLFAITQTLHFRLHYKHLFLIYRDRSPDSDRGFESVKRGGTWTIDEAGSRGPKLDLGNKYDALSHGEAS